VLAVAGEELPAAMAPSGRRIAVAGHDGIHLRDVPLDGPSP
jgi:hypothetical protein